MSYQWQPTRYGGLRRTGVAQSVKSAARIKRRSVARVNPPVLGPIVFSWGERLGLPECPYVIRWSIQTEIGSVRVHHWLSSDDVRAFHDHPWWFVTIVCRGGYTDRSPSGDDRLVAPATRWRPAEHRHTVIPDTGGAWTVLITGPSVRSWGFWIGNRFRKANKWFAERGHHPCI